MKLDNVVIVLGKRLINNQLSREGISRVTALAEAVKAMSVIKTMSVSNTAILFCGGRAEGQNVAEADAMFHYFRELNASLHAPFPENHILLENHSVNTIQNMQYAAEVLCSSGLFHTSSLFQTPVNVTLLSNDYHLERIMEIQTLMDEQGLLRVLKSRCASTGLELNIPLDISKHISVPYPHKGYLAEAFLRLDELTTYRVYLEGITNGVFRGDVTDVKAQSLRIALSAIEKLQMLPLEKEIQQPVEEMKEAIMMTASDNSMNLAKQALGKLHPTLTLLNRAVDPDDLL